MGRPSKRLSPAHIARLKAFRRSVSPRGRSYSFAEMREAMEAPFTWQTLCRAIDGKPVWEPSYDYIVAWLERLVGVKPAPARDWKRDAAGDREEPNGAPANAERLRSDRREEGGE